MDKKSITRRDFIRTSSLMAGATLFANISPANVATPKKPNVLFIVVDDLRTQLGCYGHKETITPNIDRLASDGILFEKAYCNVPVCGASRASVLTGIRPNYDKKRFTSYKARADKDSPNAITLPEHFKNNGYHTHSNGKVFHDFEDSFDSWSDNGFRPITDKSPTGEDWGNYYFDELWLDPESKKHRSKKSGRGPFYECADVADDSYEDGKIANKTCEDLRRLKNSDKPFFLACGFSKPHLPFNAPKKYYDLYDPEKIELANNRYKPKDLPKNCYNSGEITGYYGTLESGWPDKLEFHKKARHAYYACVSYVDAMIGKVYDELESSGLKENTIVVLWGDHGWHLGEHNFWGKHNTLDNALKCPMLMCLPGQKKPVRVKLLVEYVDIYPTLCELASILPPKSHKLAGRSLVEQIREPDRTFAKATFAEWGSGKTVKTERYIYTEWPDDTKMLFDHKTDPDENINIASLPENADIVSQLHQLIANLYSKEV